MKSLFYSVVGPLVIVLFLLLAFVFNFSKVRSYNFYDNHSLQNMHRTSDLESNIVARSLNA